MTEWWTSLSTSSHFFALVAIPATVVLIIQTVMIFLGIGDDGEMDDPSIGDAVSDIGAEDYDIDAMDSLHIFTLRGIIAFFVVFGWVGLVMDSHAVSLWITIPVAVLCGAVIMIALAYLLRAIMRLQSGGNIDNRNALGTSGTVYLTIPAERSGIGKVNILLQGSYVERDAVTDSADAIPTGAEIVVTGLSGQTTLVVRRK